MGNKNPLYEYFHFSLRALKESGGTGENQVLLKQLLLTVESLIMMLDNRGRITEFNPACEHASGYSRREVLGKTPDFLVPPEEQADVRAAMAKLLQGEHGDSQPLTYENHWRTKDGRKRLLVWTNSSIKDAHGEVSSIICTGQDVTEVRAEERRRAIMLDILQVLASTYDQDTVLSYILKTVCRHLQCDAAGIRLRRGDDYPYVQTIGFNDDFIRAESLLGCYRGGIPGKEAKKQGELECICGSVIRGDLSPELTTEKGTFYTGNINELAARLAKMDVSFRIRNHCGQAGYKSIALVPLRFQEETVGILQLNATVENHFSEDDIEFLTLIGRSIGAALVRFQAEQERRKTQLILDKVIQNARDGFSLATQDGEFLIYNAAMERITGYTMEEVNKHGWFYLAYPDEEERRQAVHKARQAAAGRIDFIDTVITCKDGTRKPVAISITPLEVDDKTYNFSTMIDLTPIYRS
ncbi:MAG: PAS domain S-box protein [Firmicutes bacterium]|jgi:PAS domain S-box-containing protein|nr:PAS domain S-box protein [Bacillota bacterium]